MSYIILPHTADVRLKVKNRTLAGLFQDAVLGMMEFMKAEKKEKVNISMIKQVKRKINLKSLDKTTLLIDFLNKVLLLCCTKREIYNKITFYNLSDKILKAELVGVRVVELNENIKAVTYHEACVTKTNQGNWETTIIFDI